MIKSVIATNYLGESLKMGIGDPDTSGLLISSIDGLGPGESDISITELAATDGAVYNSSRKPSRNIVINLIFKGNPTIEDSRYLTYKMFPLRKPVNFVVNTDKRSLQIDGYVESNEPSIFDKQEGTSLSVICPNPYFYSLSECHINFGAIEPLFEFPFWNNIDEEEQEEMDNEIRDTWWYPLLDHTNSPINSTPSPDAINDKDKHIIFGEIHNNDYDHVMTYEGDVETGVLMTVHFLGPATGLSIHNVGMDEVMRIDTNKLAKIVGSPIKAMDDLVISTVTGKKYLTFWRNGKSYNVLNCLDRDSDWLKLDVGRNVLSYKAETGYKNIEFDIEYHPLYEGV